MVVAYRVSGLSYRIATALASTRTVSMPNHLMPVPLVPEFLQQDATKDNLVPAVQHLLADGLDTKRMRDALGAIQKTLNLDTNNRIVDAILDTVQRS